MLSQTTEYALRAMIRLASIPTDSSLRSEAVAASTKVPQGYLSKILRDLVVADLIVSRRGPRGGFALARPAQDITMLDVVNAVDPIKRIRGCPLGNPAHVNLCPLHHRLDQAIALVERQFRETTLAEILAGARSSPSSGAPRCSALVAPRIDPRASKAPAVRNGRHPSA